MAMFGGARLAPMSMLEPKPRLKPNKDLPASAYQEFLQSWFQGIGCRNLTRLMIAFEDLTWKDRPKAWVISDFQMALHEILAIEPRGILLHKTLVEAILKEDGEVALTKFQTIIVHHSDNIFYFQATIRFFEYISN